MMEEHMCEVWRSEEKSRRQFSLSTFKSSPGIKLKSLGRCGKQAHPLRPSPTEPSHQSGKF